MADLSFDEVMRELGVSEDELKRMIADNEIRAFHEGDELKFKREDVSKLRSSLETAPTIVLSDTDADSILEEPALEEPSLEEPELELDAEDALASEETVLSVEGLLEDDSPSLEEPILDDMGGEILEGEDTAPAVETSVGEDTVLDSGLLDEEDLSLGLDDTEEEGLLDEDVRAAPRRVRARAQEASPMMTALLVVMCVILVLPGAVLVNLAGGDNGVFPPWIKENLSHLNPIIDGIINLF
jgi:excisionase family DNA binding protein